MRRHEEPPDDHGSSPGATEPITLSDPDGAVTLVAPWSSWTREQVRAPGGEPALITRLEHGQLWFSAGRRRSPWRHEVHIAKVVVSTPAGRFHVTAEPDGGATIDCLAGRTRVQAGLQEPVVLEAEQTAAVASDGDTLVVLDNAGSRAAAAAGGAATTEAGDGAAVAAAAVRADAGQVASDAPGPEPVDEAVPAPTVAGSGRRFVSRLPELVAVAALLAVLVAAVVVFSRTADPIDEVAAPARATSTTVQPTTTAPTTTTPTTTVPATTAQPTTAAPTTAPPPTVPASATGRLAACRRADGGVLATIDVSMRSGGSGQFKVGVGLVDGSGQVFARGEAQTEVLEQGASVPVDVLVSVPGAIPPGSCQLLGVEAS